MLRNEEMLKKVIKTLMQNENCIWKICRESRGNAKTRVARVKVALRESSARVKVALRESSVHSRSAAFMRCEFFIPTRVNNSPTQVHYFCSNTEFKP